MTTTRYSLHQIRDKSEISFSQEDYSKFKFGSKKIAREFGHALGKGFIQDVNFQNLMNTNRQIVVCSSPYSFVPTATFAMKDYFVQVLNEFLVNNGKNPVEEQKIHRTVTYKDDYGSLTAEQRMALIGKDKFHIDKEFVKDKILLFLDDVRITGSHEKVIQRMVNEYELDNNIMYLYFAELNNTAIHPKIENDLNFAYVKGLSQVDSIIKNEEFLINTRVVKYILNTEEDEFLEFMNKQSHKFLELLYHQAIGNGYLTMPEYSLNLAHISDALEVKI